jgi:uncharacterized integral membrane protein
MSRVIKKHIVLNLMFSLRQSRFLPGKKNIICAETTTLGRNVMKPKTIIIIVLVALLTIFIMQNTHSVQINIFFWQPSFPMIILIFILLGAGFALGYFAPNVFKIAKKKNDEF